MNIYLLDCGWEESQLRFLSFAIFSHLRSNRAPHKLLVAQLSAVGIDAGGVRRLRAGRITTKPTTASWSLMIWMRALSTGHVGATPPQRGSNKALSLFVFIVLLPRRLQVFNEHYVGARVTCSLHAVSGTRGPSGCSVVCLFAIATRLRGFRYGKRDVRSVVHTTPPRRSVELGCWEPHTYRWTDSMKLYRRAGGRGLCVVQRSPFTVMSCGRNVRTSTCGGIGERA